MQKYNPEHFKLSADKCPNEAHEVYIPMVPNPKVDKCELENLIQEFTNILVERLDQNQAVPNSIQLKPI